MSSDDKQSAIGKTLNRINLILGIIVAILTILAFLGVKSYQDIQILIKPPLNLVVTPESGPPGSSYHVYASLLSNCTFPPDNLTLHGTDFPVIAPLTLGEVKILCKVVGQEEIEAEAMFTVVSLTPAP